MSANRAFVFCSAKKDGTRREVGIVICNSVNNSEIVVLIAVRPGRQKPHECFHSRSMVVDQTSGNIFRLHRFIRTDP